MVQSWPLRLNVPAALLKLLVTVSALFVSCRVPAPVWSMLGMDWPPLSSVCADAGAANSRVPLLRLKLPPAAVKLPAFSVIRALPVS